MKIVFIFSVILFISVSAIGIPYGNGNGNSGGQGNAICPAGYKKMRRADNRWWCMKYFSGNETFFEAEKICRCQGGASLSGIENFNELKYIKDQASDAFSEEGTLTGGVWVGAYRRKDCRVDQMETKPECIKENQYQWTDRFTRGNEMWKEKWADGAPHNNKVGGHQEFCVQIQISIAPESESKSGFFDNRVCVNPDGATQFPTKGFVCGRPAKMENTYYGGGGGGNGGVIIIGDAKPEKKP
ncbi:hypothetical protein CAEBREN_14412 [Caenorhabditis brenneri]|uniref:C-type lectin domain-containing protein n=1 Tax=Caenorhabditis brenneri TaxID=135651 RepID=G0MRI4_CAEBE|nr:hypothetical protein CAEBREN_14412 [Caenorhabditis brenneri]